MSDIELKKSLNPTMIWGLGVGYVISGMYFGWNLGLPLGGSLGFLAALLFVTVMYIAFVLCYAELACAMPKAGGAFVYATRAFGSRVGFIIGFAQWIEYVFAPPAIAAAIGAYFSLFFPSLSPTIIAIFAYVIFTSLNIYGVKQSAIFELGVTILAVFELLLFTCVAAPHFDSAAFSINALPNGWMGAFAALPYAIWFYLAIEGLANVAEESINPQRDISRGFFYAMTTLVALAVMVFFAAVGVKGWEAVVYPVGSNVPSDSPLPLAIFHIVGSSSMFYHMLVTIGLFGLIASFHGIILASGRALLELGRAGFAPKITAIVAPVRQTPAIALIFNMAVGLIALISGKTGDIISIAVFGALTLYIASMIAFFRLRIKEKDLTRPFRTPWYPLLPTIALVFAVVCFISMSYYQTQNAIVYLILITLGIAYHFIFTERCFHKKS